MTTARDIMTPGCECVGEHDNVLDVARKMRDLDVGALPICGTDDRLKGMITDRDIVVRCVAEGADPRGVLAGDAATSELVYVDAEAPVETVVEAMARHQVRRMPVIADKRLIGIVAQADVARRQDDSTAGHLVGAVSEDR